MKEIQKSTDSQLLNWIRRNEADTKAASRRANQLQARVNKNASRGHLDALQVAQELLDAALDRLGLLAMVSESLHGEKAARGLA